MTNALVPQHRTTTRRALLVTAALVAALLVPTARAATPEAGTLARAADRVSWTGAFREAAMPPSPELCALPFCDEFHLRVDLPAGVWKRAGGVQIGIRWSDEAQDLGLYVYGPDGRLVASSDGTFASMAESVFVPQAGNGEYRVVVLPRLTEALKYQGLAEVEFLPAQRPRRELLPNLVSLPPRNFHFSTGAYYADAGASADSCYPEERVEDGARRCMRFDQIIANTGTGPFELRYRMDGLASDQPLVQRIYRSDGSARDREADTYEFHATHAHFHYKNFAQSLLWAADARGAKLGRSPVVTGNKNGFCMIDVENVAWGRKGDSARTYYFPRCNAPTQVSGQETYMVNGISVGWADIYNWFLPDQYLDVEGLRDGYYVLETVTDPANTIVESNETDNVMSVLIRICGDQAGIVGPGDVCS
ncbi:MAG TPA: lysyl oxidase family protein [Mycobacteriales bacterium]|nr:lysyl oxidase family protein [Mycobacteriales bacterium]